MDEKYNWQLTITVIISENQLYYNIFSKNCIHDNIFITLIDVSKK